MLRVFFLYFVFYAADALIVSTVDRLESLVFKINYLYENWKQSPNGPNQLLFLSCISEKCFQCFDTVSLASGRTTGL